LLHSARVDATHAHFRASERTGLRAKVTPTDTAPETIAGPMEIRSPGESRMESYRSFPPARDRSLLDIVFDSVFQPD
jgi:hypothetical protein